MGDFLIRLICKNIESIPTNNSPYITIEMYHASEKSLYILAKQLKVYYSQQNDIYLEWLYYWVQNRIEGEKMLINIFSSVYVPVCIGICTLFTKLFWLWPLLLLCTYFFIMLYFILREYKAKKFYEFHMRIIEIEYEKRTKKNLVQN